MIFKSDPSIVNLNFMDQDQIFKIPIAKPNLIIMKNQSFNLGYTSQIKLALTITLNQRCTLNNIDAQQRKDLYKQRKA